MGGGLAGLTLAIHLRREQPQLSVRVLERRKGAAPHAAFKVGESTVEIGAHYFDTVLGLKDHLDREQLRKFGFRFFFNEGNNDVASVTELGVSRVFPTPSYQIDRGIFENFLAERAVELGATFDDGAVVRSIDIDANCHRVRFERDGIEQTAEARWLIDASGRAGLIKRKLGLAEDNGHDANAIWFRIDDRIAIDEWSDDPAWISRTDPRERWRSTNHLCGPGYWAWLIPLSSGSHSVGIVADSRMHPLESINSFEKSMTWFAEHQPQLYRELDKRRDKLQDFAFFRHFSYGCKQVFSGDRWALTGEAGLFLDPFYSPGSDFIAIGNTYIVDLIARDFRGERLAREARLYENLYFSFYRNTLALYENQYPMFGHAELMPLKITWDYAYYWGVLCQFFFQNRLTDVALFTRLAEPLAKCEQLNRDVQTLLREAAGNSAGKGDAAWIDQQRLPWFSELNRGLRDVLSAQELEQRVRDNAAMLESLAAEIFIRVSTLGYLSEVAHPLALLSKPTIELLKEAA